MASFFLDAFTISATVNRSAGGSIVCGTTTITGTNTLTVARGDTLGCNLVPDTGYNIGNVFVNGIGVGAVSSYSFTNIQKNQTLSVTFVKKTFTITATSGPNGSITPGGTSTYSWGTSKTYYFYPSAGYHVGDVLIDGVSVGAVTGYNFTNIQANHTVSVSFVQ